MKNQYLFLFTITPVQSFIMQARKTQDLWAGSRLLSELSKAAAVTIQGFGGKVIFPSKITGDALPNRLLASFALQKETNLTKIGSTITDAIKDVLKKYGQKTEDRLGKSKYVTIQNAFEKQLKDYFSTFWVFVPIVDGDYATAYAEVDSLLGAVKNVRTFAQNPEQGRKCSLSGEQNALIFNKKPFPAYVHNAIDYSDSKIQENEGLSAMAFIKRFYPFKRQDAFDSTADIALLDAIHRFKMAFPTAQKQLETYRTYVGEEDRNTQLFFTENLTETYFNANGYSTTVLKWMKEELKDIYRQAAAVKPKISFTKYYAILLFDADDMGEWLSGKFLTHKAQLQLFHVHLSKLLLDFAEKAKKFVDGEANYKDYEKLKRGRTIYAGGDDYLGFVNLHYLFDVLKVLRELFKATVSDKLKKDEYTGTLFQLDKDEMTFSAGIAIAHYKTPLSEVLKWARTMEKEAKDMDHKDAFGLAVLKHSGEIHKTVLPFKYSNGDYVSDDLATLIENLKNGTFSNRFIVNLERELNFFDDDFEYRQRIVKSESLRLIKRAQNHDKGSDMEAYKTVTAILEKIYNVTQYRTTLNDNHFHTTLSICDFINRKQTSNE